MAADDAAREGRAPSRGCVMSSRPARVPRWPPATGVRPPGGCGTRGAPRAVAMS